MPTVTGGGFRGECTVYRHETIDVAYTVCANTWSVWSVCTGKECMHQSPFRKLYLKSQRRAVPLQAVREDGTHQARLVRQFSQLTGRVRHIFRLEVHVLEHLHQVTGKQWMMSGLQSKGLVIKLFRGGVSTCCFWGVRIKEHLRRTNWAGQNGCSTSSGLLTIIGEGVQGNLKQGRTIQNPLWGDSSRPFVCGPVE